MGHPIDPLILLVHVTYHVVLAGIGIELAMRTFRRRLVV